MVLLVRLIGMIVIVAVPCNTRVLTDVGEAYSDTAIDLYHHARDEKRGEYEEKVITELSENITVLAGAVQQIQNVMEGLQKKIDEVTLCGVQPVFYPIDTKQHCARTWYPDRKLIFVGFGFYGSRTGQHSVADNVTNVEACADACKANMLEKKAFWNGMTYYWKLKLCRCYKNDVGNTYATHLVHYNFVE